MRHKFRRSTAEFLQEPQKGLALTLITLDPLGVLTMLAVMLCGISLLHHT
ncbi:MAG: hypothetical protein H0W76_02315 [Pyrinomonadaceae bacterium]|nr:hypothetical protein [Pyrinomonadaceae bacterium]